MAANDSGVDTSGDSNDGIPGAKTKSKMIDITPPPAIMPPTPTSSPNTHEWPNINTNAFQLNRGEHFALPHLPPLPLNTDYVLHPSTLPSGSHLSQFKMRLRTRTKQRLRSNYNNVLAESNARKLRNAAQTCNIELLTRILESGVDPNAVDEYKRSPLHLAACRGYFHIVQELLKFGANPNVVDSLGNTPLHLAVISCNANNFSIVVSILLEGGASVIASDRSGKTPLELAQSKLRMMRARYNPHSMETAKVLEDMCKVTTLILRYMVKQQRELEDLSALEQRLQNLSTSDDQKQVVSQTADELLASVERLSINK